MTDFRIPFKSLYTSIMPSHSSFVKGSLAWSVRSAFSNEPFEFWRPKTNAKPDHLLHKRQHKGIVLQERRHPSIMHWIFIQEIPYFCLSKVGVFALSGSALVALVEHGLTITEEPKYAAMLAWHRNTCNIWLLCCSTIPQKVLDVWWPGPSHVAVSLRPRRVEEYGIM